MTSRGGCWLEAGLTDRQVASENRAYRRRLVSLATVDAGDRAPSTATGRLRGRYVGELS
jgi:hypothetical protein